MKAHREKAFLLSLIFSPWFVIMKNWRRTSWVGVIKNWRGTISWGRGARGVKNNWGRVKVVSRCYKPLWALHHISPILCQISEHLEHALLTSRNTRKSETTLLSFFNSILKYWVVTSPLKIFKWAEKTHRVLISQISQNQNKHNNVHIYTYHENNVLSPWLSSYKNQT